MNFIEKKIAHDRLLAESHLDADRKLLIKHDPRNQFVNVVAYNATQTASEILWALLDWVSEEDIVKNRRECCTPQEPINPESNAEIILDTVAAESEKGAAVEAEKETIQEPINPEPNAEIVPDPNAVKAESEKGAAVEAEKETIQESINPEPNAEIVPDPNVVKVESEKVPEKKRSKKASIPE